MASFGLLGAGASRQEKSVKDRPRRLDIWEVAAFVFGISIISCFVGMAIAQYHIPPYQAIKETLRVARALTTSDLYSFPRSAPGTGVVAHDERKSAPGVTFVTRY